jgi:hypothetical protein
MAESVSASAEAAEAAVEAPEERLLPEGFTDMVGMVVFDFDLTVLRIHSFGLRISVEEVAKRDLKDDFTDLDHFLALCRCLKDAGVHVAIASFGVKRVIQEYITLASDPPAVPLEAVSTPADVGFMDGSTVPGGKNRQLAHLKEAFKYDRPNNSILLFDGEYQLVVSSPRFASTPFP